MATVSIGSRPNIQPGDIGRLHLQKGQLIQQGATQAAGILSQTGRGFADAQQRAEELELKWSQITDKKEKLKVMRQDALEGLHSNIDKQFANDPEKAKSIKDSVTKRMEAMGTTQEGILTVQNGYNGLLNARARRNAINGVIATPAETGAAPPAEAGPSRTQGAVTPAVEGASGAPGVTRTGAGGQPAQPQTIAQAGAEAVAQEKRRLAKMTFPQINWDDFSSKNVESVLKSDKEAIQNWKEGYKDQLAQRFGQKSFKNAMGKNAEAFVTFAMGEAQKDGLVGGVFGLSEADFKTSQLQTFGQLEGQDVARENLALRRRSVAAQEKEVGLKETEKTVEDFGKLHSSADKKQAKAEKALLDANKIQSLKQQLSEELAKGDTQNKEKVARLKRLTKEGGIQAGRNIVQAQATKILSLKGMKDTALKMSEADIKLFVEDLTDGNGLTKNASKEILGLLDDTDKSALIREIKRVDFENKMGDAVQLLGEGGGQGGGQGGGGNLDAKQNLLNQMEQQLTVETDEVKKGQLQKTIEALKRQLGG